ncbi:MAG: polysaccharide deacetylase family protein [Lachnospiraceae bacterium]|nr:polysaccharide deacetylase family protein [Lachnospiraceae bacterium]
MIRNQKIKTLFKILVFMDILLLFAIGIFIKVFNKYSIEFNVEDEFNKYIEYGEIYSETEISATYKGSILGGQGESLELVKEGEVDTKKLGTYTVTYTAKHNGMEENITINYIVADNAKPVIELVTNKDTYTSPKDKYVEEGFTAKDNYDGDLTDKVIREEKDGIVYYTVSDSAGNTTTVEREIVYKDAVPPVITLNGEADVKISTGEEYVEAGFVAADDCDGDISDKVVISGAVDTSKNGSYVIAYQVKDSYGNECIVNRNITVQDITPPSITLKGDKNQYIKLGSTYSEPGFSALDTVDGDMTGKVEVSGSVDTSKTGTYTISYKVTDSAGNSSSVSRQIYVFDKQAEVNSVDPGNKVVYLTFDDGPGPYTARLLDILDKYNVKATFFVTGQKLGYKDMIGEAHRRGHTIALHTYSHQYSIYKSEETYFADLKKIEDICVAQTGVKPTIVRFPGGTSNTISENYCKKIMTTLSKSLGYRGYLYCDWNVSSGDAGGAKTKEEVANNVINGMKRNDVSIVLQHDIVKFSVDAVEKIIVWGLANGYTFLPMDETTPMYHHRPNN